MQKCRNLGFILVFALSKDQNALCQVSHQKNEFRFDTFQVSGAVLLTICLSEERPMKHHRCPWNKKTNTFLQHPRCYEKSSINRKVQFTFFAHPSPQLLTWGHCLNIVSIFVEKDNVSDSKSDVLISLKTWAEQNPIHLYLVHSLNLTFSTNFARMPFLPVSPFPNSHSELLLFPYSQSEFLLFPYSQSELLLPVRVQRVGFHGGGPDELGRHGVTQAVPMSVPRSPSGRAGWRWRDGCWTRLRLPFETQPETEGGVSRQRHTEFQTEFQTFVCFRQFIPWYPMFTFLPLHSVYRTRICQRTTVTTNNSHNNRNAVVFSVYHR